MALVRKMMARGAVPANQEGDVPDEGLLAGDAEGEAEGAGGAMELLDQIDSAVEALAEAAPTWSEDVQALQALVRSMKRKYAGPGGGQTTLPL